jgi:competence protein ComGD
LSLHPKRNGFTLIEMLVILSIVMTMISFSFFHLRGLYERKVIEQFLVQLQEDIWLAQQFAIAHSKSVELSFYENEDYYDVRESGLRSLIIKRTIMSEISIRILTITNPIKFNSSGNINGSGAMYVMYNNQTYKITFLLGRGRFRIEQL